MDEVPTIYVRVPRFAVERARLRLVTGVHGVFPRIFLNGIPARERKKERLPAVTATRTKNAVVTRVNLYRVAAFVVVIRTTGRAHYNPLVAVTARLKRLVLANTIGVQCRIRFQGIFRLRAVSFNAGGLLTRFFKLGAARCLGVVVVVSDGEVDKMGVPIRMTLFLMILVRA